MRNTRLDAYKGLACIFVIFIHCNFPGQLGTIVKGIARFAVPLFFIISGYFTICSDEKMIWKVIGKKIRHIMVLLAYCSMLWIFYEFVMHCFVGNKISVYAFLKQFFAPRNFYTLLLFNNPSGFLGGGGVLWFMFALVYCYVAFGLIAKTKTYCIAYMFIPITLILNFSIEHGVIQFAEKYNTMFVTNFWVFGYPLFMIGNLLRKNKEKICSNHVWIFSIITGVVLSIIGCLNWNAELYIGSIFLAVGLLMHALASPTGGKFIDFFAYIGNKLSLIVYAIHYMVMVVFDKAITKIGLGPIYIDSYFRPIIVMLASITISWIVIYLRGVKLEMSLFKKTDE